MSTQYNQVSVDLINMVFTACTYLALAGVAWVFLRLLQACFWLPKHLKKQNNVQQMLQDKVDSYEKYVLECEEKEKLMGTEEVKKKSQENSEENPEENLEENPEEKPDEKPDEQTLAERWKERRECLEMLKRELKRVQDGGDPYDWDHLLDDTDDEEKKEDAVSEAANEEEKKTKNLEADFQEEEEEVEDEKVCLLDADKKKDK